MKRLIYTLFIIYTFAGFITSIGYAAVKSPLHQLPIADFTASPTTGDAPLTVQFNDTSINATTWNWNFGDGSSSTLPNPKHTFANAGSYIVTQTASNSFGSALKTITITGTGAGLTPTPLLSSDFVPPDPTVKAYGAPWRWFDLDNLNIGTDPNNCHGLYVSYRFRADHTGQVDSGRFYFQVRGSGYAAGNGGVIRCELQTDDGTVNHFPSGQVLAFFQIDHPQQETSGQGLLTLRPFNTVATLTSGQIYHLVFTNKSTDPRRNWYDIDNLCNPPRTPIQSAVSDTNYAALRKIDDNSPWILDERIRSDTPIFTLYYTDGYSIGQAYLQVYSTNGESWKVRGGTGRQSNLVTQVRETFTVSGGDKYFSTMNVALWKNSGSNPNPLILRVEKSDGSLVAHGTIPAASVPSGDRLSINWVSYAVNPPCLLSNGVTYNFVVSAPGSSTAYYNLLPMMKGSNFSFAGWEFKDGWIEKKTGTGAWIAGVPEHGNGGKGFDMMFYLQ